MLFSARGCSDRPVYHTFGIWLQRTQWPFQNLSLASQQYRHFFRSVDKTFDEWLLTRPRPAWHSCCVLFSSTLRTFLAVCGTLPCSVVLWPKQDRTRKCEPLLAGLLLLQTQLAQRRPTRYVSPLWEIVVAYTVLWLVVWFFWIWARFLLERKLSKGLRSR